MSATDLTGTTLTSAMSDSINSTILWLHGAFLRVTEELTPAHFCDAPGPQAPPIGWHLWHIARWADRVRTAMPARTDERHRQLWEAEGLAHRFQLNPADLGVVGCGEGMDCAVAIRLPRQIGQENILAYARRTFAALDQAIDTLTVEDIGWVRPDCRPLRITEHRQMVPAPPGIAPLYADLFFHVNHADRHLGMIEAIRGVYGLVGTASA